MGFLGLGIAPTSSTSNEELLDFNRRGALTGLLAIEEHLQQLPQNADRSWCVKKHALLVCDHHLAEAVNHASRIDQAKAEACRKLRAVAEEILKPSDPLHLPRLEDVSRLRNEVRNVFSDPTLFDRSCSVCSKDSGLGMHPLHPLHPYRNGPAMHGASMNEDVFNRAAFFFGMGVMGVIAGFGLGSKAPNKLALLMGVGSLFYANKLVPMIELTPSQAMSEAVKTTTAF